MTLLGITPGDGRELDGWLAAVAEGGIPAVLIREPGLGLVALDRLVAEAVDRIAFVAVHARNPHAGNVAARWGATLHGSGRTGANGWGFSAHTEAEALSALGDGARYALLSPIWRPTSKPGDRRPPLGPDRYLAVARGRPILALGGVTPERFRGLLAAGASGAAILGPLAGGQISEMLARYLR